MALDDLIYRAITGRSPRTEPKTFRPMLDAVMRAVGGPRHTKAAAGVLGVSQRTVQRWLKGTQRPTPAAYSRLAGLQRRLRLPVGRQARLAAANTVRIHVRYATEDRTRILSNVSLRWAVGGVDAVITAWLTGDDQAAITAFLNGIGDITYREAIIKGLTGYEPNTASDFILIIEKVEFRAR